eukprot:1159741-Pelagomonas_calceolata.AAC.14
MQCRKARQADVFTAQVGLETYLSGLCKIVFGRTLSRGGLLGKSSHKALEKLGMSHMRMKSWCG